jgi:Ferritin-like
MICLKEGFSMRNSDPITRLTKAEGQFVHWLNTHRTRVEVLAELKANLQTAIEIEIATIPIYLYTYYSINRNATSGENIGPAELFANKAGGVIMSVAVEEMLHMSLSSNVLFALGVDPQLYGKAPAHYPTGLPYHDPKGPSGPNGATAVSIPLARLGFEQLWHFLQIEYPEKYDSMPEDRNWHTIGQFYSYIRCLICTDFVTDADFQIRAAEQAIQPGNYSPNNVDTVYPSEKFDPWKPAPPEPTPAWAAPDPHKTAAKAAIYPNAADSHAGPRALLAIRSRRDALEAIDTICDQGEGYPVPWEGPAPIDDRSKREESHYYKLLTLQAQFEDYKHNKETLAPMPVPPGPIAPTVTAAELDEVIIGFPDNPVTTDYPPDFQPISTFCSAVFQYMLIMTETIYRVPPESQKRFFNEGLHRSMIWVLDKYIRTIRQIPLPAKSGLKQYMAPTFENVDLGPRQESFARLTELGNAAIDAANGIIGRDKKGPLFDVMQDVKYYVAVATTTTRDEHPMHLPDVAQYWAVPGVDKAAPSATGHPLPSDAGRSRLAIVDKPTPSAAGQALSSDAGPSLPPGAGEPVPTSYPYEGVPAFPPETLAGPRGMALHGCMGLNSCKGSDRYGVKGPDSSGPNACAGQGYCSTTADHNCHVQNDCRNQGGCGLYGTAAEMDQPGSNDCRSLGSCATPINAERFSTNGPNQGNSVWARAREVFKDQVWPGLRQELLAKQARGEIPRDQPLPERLGPVPAPFAETGPTYLWISDYNKERGNMTACGASGMSGAGGCSS